MPLWNSILKIKWDNAGKAFSKTPMNSCYCYYSWKETKLEVLPWVFMLGSRQVVESSRVFQSRVVEGNLMSLSLKNKGMNKRSLEMPRDHLKRELKLKENSYEKVLWSTEHGLYFQMQLSYDIRSSYRQLILRNQWAKIGKGFHLKVMIHGSPENSYRNKTQESEFTPHWCQQFYTEKKVSV